MLRRSRFWIKEDRPYAGMWASVHNLLRHLFWTFMRGVKSVEFRASCSGPRLCEMRDARMRWWMLNVELKNE